MSSFPHLVPSIYLQQLSESLLIFEYWSQMTNDQLSLHYQYSESHFVFELILSHDLTKEEIHQRK